jgi:hypothetical protein
MKHARPDYNRIQDPAGLIPPDEPVFLLRAQDEFAADTLRDYAARVQLNRGASADLVAATLTQADAMDAWPHHKAPDLPASDEVPLPAYKADTLGDALANAIKEASALGEDQVRLDLATAYGLLRDRLATEGRPLLANGDPVIFAPPGGGVEYGVIEDVPPRDSYPTVLVRFADGRLETVARQRLRLDPTRRRAEPEWLDQLSRLDVKPGDRFVMMADRPVSAEMQVRVALAWRDFMGPEAPPLFIPPFGWKLGAIRAEEPAPQFQLRVESGELFTADRVRELMRTVNDAKAGPAFAPTHEHWKGGLYRVIARGRQETDLSDVVVYEGAAGDVWVRRAEDFNATLPDGRPRFRPLTEPPEAAPHRGSDVGRDPDFGPGYDPEAHGP